MKQSSYQKLKARNLELEHWLNEEIQHKNRMLGDISFYMHENVIYRLKNEFRKEIGNAIWQETSIITDEFTFTPNEFR